MCLGILVEELFDTKPQIKHCDYNQGCLNIFINIMGGSKKIMTFDLTIALVKEDVLSSSAIGISH